jgi:hypothetical protein
MDRLNSDQGSMSGQMSHYKNRIQELENQLQQVHEEKTEQGFENRRLTQENEQIQAQM